MIKTVFSLISFAVQDSFYVTGKIASFLRFCFSGGQGSHPVSNATEHHHQQIVSLCQCSNRPLNQPWHSNSCILKKFKKHHSWFIFHHTQIRLTKSFQIMIMGGFVMTFMMVILKFSLHLLKRELQILWHIMKKSMHLGLHHVLTNHGKKNTYI